MKKKLTKEEKKFLSELRKEVRRKIRESRVYRFRFPKEIKKYLKYVRDYVRWIEACEYDSFGSPESSKNYAAKLANNLFVTASTLATKLEDFANLNPENPVNPVQTTNN